MTRVLLRVLTALVLLAVTGVVGWRVLRPAEVVDEATDTYPAAADVRPKVTGRTLLAPLIVDGRLRVFGTKRQVRADAPVQARTTFTPRWSLRRWPQQLNGVVAAGATVVSRWSDGRLVAIDGRTGKVAWRAGGPEAGGYVGELTGATTVWAPPGLHRTATVVMAVGGGQVAAYDLATGARRWAADCAGPGFATAGGQFVCGTTVHQADTGAPARGWSSGPYTALSCGVAASDCAGVRDAAGQGWLVTGAAPQRAPGLDTTGEDPAVVGPEPSAGAVVEARPAEGAVVARSPATGKELWRRLEPAGAIVLGATGATVTVLGADRRLTTLDAVTGKPGPQFRFAFGTERVDWVPGRWQVAGPFLAVERLTDDGKKFGQEAVLIASLGRARSAGG